VKEYGEGAALLEDNPMLKIWEARFDRLLQILHERGYNVGSKDTRQFVRQMARSFQLLTINPSNN
jgi:hypothetical protein